MPFPAVVERTSRLPFPAESVFAWHERPGAFERLTPPWERAEVLERSGGLGDGARTVVRVRAPFSMRWVARHREYAPGRRFVDEQVQGPFAQWVHVHRFEPDGPDGCIMTDRIEYVPPLGWAGAAADPVLIRPRLLRMLAYRHELLRGDLEAHARYAGLPRMRIAISGATGLLGRELGPFLTTGGHEVVRLSRTRSGNGDIHWDYERGHIDRDRLEGLDAVVHLAGENVGARWTAERRNRIRESRAIGTRFLTETLARLRRRPKVLVSASGIGIFGNRGEEVLTDASPVTGGPADFLSEVGREWEAATRPATDAGIRVVMPRFGVVLTPAGGALARLLPAFRLGLGGPIGHGRQWMSWIGVDDVVGIVLHALASEELAGPVNTVAPNPVPNREFAATLGHVLGRPAILPVPAPALRLVFGEMAKETILTSARALPTRLLEAGYVFRHPQLEGALRFLLGRPAGT